MLASIVTTRFNRETTKLGWSGYGRRVKFILAEARRRAIPGAGDDEQIMDDLVAAGRAGPGHRPGPRVMRNRARMRLTALPDGARPRRHPRSARSVSESCASRDPCARYRCRRPDRSVTRVPRVPRAVSDVSLRVST